jgi:cytoskeletal protein RodZ
MNAECACAHTKSNVRGVAVDFFGAPIFPIQSLYVLVLLTIIPARMLAQTAQQALRASRRPLTAPRAIALARQASSAGPSRAAATAPKKSSSKSASASSSASAGPSSSNTSEPVVKPRPEELPRTGFFAQRTKPGPPTTKAKNADLVVPPLARPPGVPNPPTTAAKTWSERKEQYLDADRHQAKRKAL